jgi:glycyl-tRNA synthetase beta chain
VPLEEQARKLSQIVFHEKLGTVADKAERVAKLARWLVEQGIVGKEEGAEESVRVERSRDTSSSEAENGSREGLGSARQRPSTSLGANDGGYSPSRLAELAETAARLCKADLVTQMVGEFPELQGIIGGYLARAQGHPDAVADAIRDHYKPVGQGDEVPTAPVTVAVSLADKLDTLFLLSFAGERASGSRDPYALRRTALAVIALLERNGLRLGLGLTGRVFENLFRTQSAFKALSMGALKQPFSSILAEVWPNYPLPEEPKTLAARLQSLARDDETRSVLIDELQGVFGVLAATPELLKEDREAVEDFAVDRLKVQQREAGVRHDLIDAVFALGGEDDLVRLLARVRALQAFVETPEGTDLLAGYKRAANILKKEGWGGASRAMANAENEGIPQTGEEDPLVLVDDPDLAEAVAAFNERHPKKTLSYTPLDEEQKLIAALDSAEPKARAAIEAEDFEGAMAALASLRAPVDAFFDKVTVNDPDHDKRESRLNLLARMRDAVHQVADFSRIEG